MSDSYMLVSDTGTYVYVRKQLHNSTQDQINNYFLIIINKKNGIWDPIYFFPFLYIFRRDDSY